MKKPNELKGLFEKVQNLRIQYTDVNDKINTCSDRIASLEAEMKTWGYFTPQRKDMSNQVATLKTELAKLTKEESAIKKELSKYPSIDEIRNKLIENGIEIPNVVAEAESIEYENELVAVDDKSLLKVVVNQNSPEFIKKAAEAEAKSFSDAKAKYKAFKNAKVGDYVKFGEYYQSNKQNKEEIEWKVIAKKSKRILLLTKYAIDCKPYNKTDKPTTWADSSMRKWLNDEFLKENFTSGEEKLIDLATVNADKNSNYATSPGFKTKDKVFVLSIVEVKKHLGRKGLDCKPTNYTKDFGAYIDEDNGNCWWWLRTPGEKPTDAAYVGVDGEIRYPGDSVYIGSGSVRPVLWIDLTKLN